mmetsp:Transcript_83640/g.138319  ORF Transcript_83640/g.138319 Transcript_83640/m.138319 type:complete len:207 (+) Transcript_83640:885-1505(+)
MRTVMLRRTALATVLEANNPASCFSGSSSSSAGRHPSKSTTKSSISPIELHLIQSQITPCSVATKLCSSGRPKSAEPPAAPAPTTPPRRAAQPPKSFCQRASFSGRMRSPKSPGQTSKRFCQWSRCSSVKRNVSSVNSELSASTSSPSASSPAATASVSGSPAGATLRSFTRHRCGNSSALSASATGPTTVPTSRGRSSQEAVESE